MAVELRVREAGIRDALEVLTLRRAVLAENRFFISREEELHTTVEQQICRITELKQSPNQAMFVARRDQVVLGFVVMQTPPLVRMRHVVKLEVLVLARARDGGIGRTLMEAAIRWAEGTEVEKIGLSVFADNARALALYASLGFLEEGRRVREYKMQDGTYRDDVLLYRPTG